MLLPAIAMGACALVAVIVYDRSSKGLSPGQAKDIQDRTTSSENDHSQGSASRGLEGMFYAGISTLS